MGWQFKAALILFLGLLLGGFIFFIVFAPSIANILPLQSKGFESWVLFTSKENTYTAMFPETPASRLDKNGVMVTCAKDQSGALFCVATAPLKEDAKEKELFHAVATLFQKTSLEMNPTTRSGPQGFETSFKDRGKNVSVFAKQEGALLFVLFQEADQGVGREDFTFFLDTFQTIPQIKVDEL